MKSLSAKAGRAKTRAAQYQYRLMHEAAREDARGQARQDAVRKQRAEWEAKLPTYVNNVLVESDCAQRQQEAQLDLEKRQMKLRVLVADEEDGFLRDMMSQMQTSGPSKYARMQARVDELKKRRQREQNEFIEERLERQRRDQCHELREFDIKRHEQLVCAQREEQLRIKAELEQRKKEEEAAYDRILAEQEQKLYAAELAEKQAKAAEQRRAQQILAAQREEEMRQQEASEQSGRKERELLQLRTDLMKLDEMRHREKKVLRQDAARDDLNRMVEYKQRRLEAEKEAENLPHIPILAHSAENREERARRKAETYVADQQYLQFLKEQKQEAERRQKEEDGLIEVELALAQDKQTQKWKLEEDARRMLNADVNHSRKHQLEDKLEAASRMREDEHRQEKEMLVIRKLKDEVDDKRASEKQLRNEQYWKDLVDQIEYNKLEKLKEDVEKEREQLAGKKREAYYNQKLEEYLKHNTTTPDLRAALKRGQVEVYE